MPQVVDEGKRHWECDHDWQEFIDPQSGGFMRWIAKIQTEIVGKRQCQMKP